MFGLIPKIMQLRRGVIKCGNCRTKLALSDFEALRVQQCSNCGSHFFCPLKVKEYWLYKPLGAGGRGSVYKAMSEKNRRNYAVKVLSRIHKYNPDFIRILMAEGEKSYSLGTHPHLVQTIDYGSDGDEYFIATEFINGQRLDNLIESAGRMPEKLCLEIIFQIIEAETRIVQCGYLYRDLKPENVMIEKTGNVRLIDYGLCTPLQEVMEKDGNDNTFEGSPLFVPPERIYGTPEGEFSEIYSLGMLLYNMLAGRTYFRGQDARNIVRKHVKALRLPSVSFGLNHCNETTIAIIDKMIKRDPNHRFFSFEELKEALKNAYNEVRKQRNSENNIRFKDFAGRFFTEDKSKTFIGFSKY